MRMLGTWGHRSAFVTFLYLQNCCTFFFKSPKNGIKRMSERLIKEIKHLHGGSEVSPPRGNSDYKGENVTFQRKAPAGSTLTNCLQWDSTPHTLLVTLRRQQRLWDGPAHSEQSKSNEEGLSAGPWKMPRVWKRKWRSCPGFKDTRIELKNESSARMFSFFVINSITGTILIGTNLHESTDSMLILSQC